MGPLCHKVRRKSALVISGGYGRKSALTVPFDTIGRHTPIIGWRKTLSYVSLVAVFSAASGLLYGAYVDGTSLLLLALGLAIFTAVLIIAVLRIRHHQHRDS